MIDDVVLSNAESIMKVCGNKEIIEYLESRGTKVPDWKSLVTNSIEETRSYLATDKKNLYCGEKWMLIEEWNTMMNHITYLQWRLGILEKMELALS